MAQPQGNPMNMTLPGTNRSVSDSHPGNRANILDRVSVFVVLSLLAIGAFVAENFLWFPLSVPYMKSLAGGAPILDMRFGYTPAAAYQLLDTLGTVGRSAYLKLLWRVDLFLPILFGLFLSLAIRHGAFRTWRAVPLAGTAFDYAENIAITFLLVRYPKRIPILVFVAASFTLMKQIFYATGVILAAGGAVVRITSPLIKNFLPTYARHKPRL